METAANVSTTSLQSARLYYLSTCTITMLFKLQSFQATSSVSKMLKRLSISKIVIYHRF